MIEIKSCNLCFYTLTMHCKYLAIHHKECSSSEKSKDQQFYKLGIGKTQASKNLTWKIKKHIATMCLLPLFQFISYNCMYHKELF